MLKDDDNCPANPLSQSLKFGIRQQVLRSLLLSMDTLLSLAAEESHVDLLHEIGNRLATADGFREVLTRVVEFASALVKCDSCLIYVLDGDELVLRASKNPHPDAVDRL